MYPRQPATPVLSLRCAHCGVTRCARSGDAAGIARARCAPAGAVPCGRAHALSGEARGVVTVATSASPGPAERVEGGLEAGEQRLGRQLAHVARARLAQASDHGGPLVLRGAVVAVGRERGVDGGVEPAARGVQVADDEKPTREAVANPPRPERWLGTGRGTATPGRAPPLLTAGEAAVGGRITGLCAGPPRGDRNAWMPGQRTAEALAWRRRVRDWSSSSSRVDPRHERGRADRVDAASPTAGPIPPTVAPRSRRPRRSRWNCGAGAGQGGSPRPAAPASGVHVRPPVVAGRTIACPCLVGPLSKRPARRPRRPPAGSVPTSRVPDARPR